MWQTEDNVAANDADDDSTLRCSFLPSNTTASSRRRGCVYCVGVCVVLVAIVVGLVVSSLRRLDTEEVGLQYDAVQRVLHDKLYYAGLHLGPPGYHFITFPKTYRSLAFNDLKCLNHDGLEIFLDVQFQYLARLNGPDVKRLILQFGDHETFETVVRLAAEEVIHETCGAFNVTQFQSELVNFQNTIQRSLDTRLIKDFTTNVIDVQVSDIKRPGEYEKVIVAKESAKQNIKIARQERPRVLTAARTKELEAKTQANITMNVARSNARVKLSRASTQAHSIWNAYRTEAETYAEVKETQGLSIEGLLSYLTTRVIENVNTVNVNLKPPA